MTRAYRAHGLDPILLITPTTSAPRRAAIAEQGGGFLYLVALRGVTGVQAASADAATAMVADVRKVTDLPIAVGVGIRTPEQVADIGQAADAVVVGSALVAVIGDHGAKPDLAQQVERAAAALVRALPTRGSLNRTKGPSYA